MYQLPLSNVSEKMEAYPAGSMEFLIQHIIGNYTAHVRVDRRKGNPNLKATLRQIDISIRAIFCLCLGVVRMVQEDRSCRSSARGQQDKLLPPHLQG